ncbi:MAG: glycoside hydrolase family 172 protein, partial [Rikenellaceae bacterium]
MKTLPIFLTILFITWGCCDNHGQIPLSECQYAVKAPKGVETRWASAENPDALPGVGGMSNNGAKGDAYTLIAPQSTKVIFDQNGAGMITKIWSANSILWSTQMRRNVIINIYWDNQDKPAVSVPLAEFFGNGLGVYCRFETALFSNPEAKSHNCFIPMPYRKAAKIEIDNQSESMIMFYYKINFLKAESIPDDALYFHAYWNRELKTELGKDYEILPKVEGNGRYLGTHIGVIGDTIYRGSWFGEGEVKIYLDGDDKYPTLCGTGTEDYIGTGWGQGEYVTRVQGSLISDDQNCLYSFIDT